ncbi:MAG TPA: polysaccharide lyase family protein, partial [Candidatus Acidoferrales bacterium]|nr:polysaccharide lyase family protein [Candidatus Acidoferrales bacterium]
MNKTFWLLLLCALPFAACADTSVVFQIGVPDGDYHEFAIAGDYSQYPEKFPNDVNYTVGQSDPARDWPFILPGPVDGWAGNRSHAFTIHFQLSQVESGFYQLVVDFVNAHDGAPPDLVINVNGGAVRQQLPRGAGGDASLTNPKAGKPYSLNQLIPAKVLHAGNNAITLSSDSGSWALFDDVRLESGVPAPAETLTMEAEALPLFKKSADGLGRAIRLSINSLEWNSMPAELDWSSQGTSGSQQVNLNFGENEPLLIVPDTGEVDVTLKTADHNIKLPVTLPPAKKWLLYIVPTVHTDIGYTDFQSRIKVRHANNGQAALQMLNDYPDFKWYSETFWQLNVCLLLHPELTDAIFGQLREKRWGLSADYANMLTGLCSSE